MIKLQDIYSDKGFSLEAREAAMNHDFDAVRSITFKTDYFDEEVKYMSTEEIHEAWIETDDEDLKSIGERDEDNWNRLEEERLREERDLHQLESERQDI